MFLTIKIFCRHPEIINPEIKKVLWENPEDVQYSGLLKVQVLPPRNLYLPVLPMRLEERLLFCLCYKCAIDLKEHNFIKSKIFISNFHFM